MDIVQKKVKKRIDKLYSSIEMDAFIEKQKQILLSKPIKDKTKEKLYTRLKGIFSHTFTPTMSIIYREKLMKMVTEVWDQVKKSQGISDIEDNENNFSSDFWKKIERGFNAVKKDFAVLHSYCIARLGIPSASFVNYLIPLIRSLESAITDMFLHIHDQQFDETKFLTALIKFKKTSDDIDEEIENRNKEDLSMSMDIFNKEVDRFIKQLQSFNQFIILKSQEVIKIKHIKPPTM